MKTAIICEINNFLVKIVKHVSGLMVVVIPPETLELGIANENGHKTQERRIVGHPLKHASGLMVHANPRGAPKQCGITHENDPQMRKR